MSLPVSYLYTWYKLQTGRKISIYAYLSHIYFFFLDIIIISFSKNQKEISRHCKLKLFQAYKYFILFIWENFTVIFFQIQIQNSSALKHIQQKYSVEYSFIAKKLHITCSLNSKKLQLSPILR